MHVERFEGVADVGRGHFWYQNSDREVAKDLGFWTIKSLGI